VLVGWFASDGLVAGQVRGDVGLADSWPWNVT